MRKILFILPVLLMAYACNFTPEGYKIEGKFENGFGQIVYLDEITSSSITPVDSATIDKNGEFVFTGKSSGPKFFLLKTDRENFLYLLIDSLDQAKITADASDLMGTYSVKGSKESELVQEISYKLKETTVKMDSIKAIYRANVNNSNIDSIRMELDKGFDSVIGAQRDFITAFIEENPSSFASMMALYQQVGRAAVLTPQEDMKYFEIVDNALMAKYPNSEHVQSLHVNVLEMKSQLKAEETAKKKTKIGAVAPEITLPTPKGESFSLSSLRGKYVLIDFWASWCRPCLMENPVLVKAYKKYSRKGFDILQVSLDKEKGAWVEAIKAGRLNKWNHVSDLKYWDCAPAREYGIQSVPSNLLLDKEGKIIAKDLRGSALEEKLKEIL